MELNMLWTCKSCEWDKNNIYGMQSVCHWHFFTRIFPLNLINKDIFKLNHQFLVECEKRMIPLVRIIFWRKFGFVHEYSQNKNYENSISIETIAFGINTCSRDIADDCTVPHTKCDVRRKRYFAQEHQCKYASFQMPKWQHQLLHGTFYETHQYMRVWFTESAFDTNTFGRRHQYQPTFISIGVS